jgi:hypothetical protein
MGAADNSSHAQQSSRRAIEGPRAARLEDRAVSMLCSTKYAQSPVHSKLFFGAT